MLSNLGSGINWKKCLYEGVIVPTALHGAEAWGVRSRGDPRVLIWFGHVVRMDEYRMVRRILMAEVSVGWVRGRSRSDLMDGAKVAFGNRGMTLEAAQQCAKDRKKWGTHGAFVDN